ncbi:hypothetical protein [Nonomuraea lactucae]|uniref:hypothetical protein n=1 Tax=Nonomuraea lactucae TaxID=2249762 RepID=UPI000DE47A65|nr:hypothetical protein [Nonomuraea lactucae]
MGLKVGDVVEVRAEAEILATLDERGELDGLPFMPEMRQFCGRRMTVRKVAHKLCDTIDHGRMRRMERAVHLDRARCDGQAHGGCQTACSLYWKEAWLVKVGDTPRPPAAPTEPATALLPLLEVNSRKPPGPEGEERFSCQATELLRAAPACLPVKDVRQYVTDVRTGNAGVLATLRGLFFALFNRYQSLSRRLLPRRLWIKGGLSWGFVPGGRPGRTPTGTLDLQPGELVRIRSKQEIVGTLDHRRHNRGLGFEEEMARHCGRTARVAARVERCVDERTGELLQMKNPCIILDGVFCGGFYSVNCPREFVPFWREIWLERIEEPAR